MRLEDCCEFQEGYVNPSQKIDEYFNGHIKWLRASDLNGGFVYETERTLTDEGYMSAGKSASMFPAGSLAISKSGTIGRVGILRDQMCGNRAVINVRPKPDKVDLYYVFYTLKNARDVLLGKTGGSIQKNLYISALETLPLVHKKLCEQEKVAAVLSAFDAKIDLNNRINAELEALAKTIYDYWFVQFDFPDKNGRPYKSSGGKMVWNDTLKREIPAGWKAVSLLQIAPVSNAGIDPSTTEDRLFRHISIPSYDATGSFAFEYGRDIGSNKFTVSDLDLLVSKLNPRFNRVVADTGYESLICSTEFVVCRCANALKKAFLEIVATSDHFITYCCQSVSSTSGSHKRVNPQIMMNYAIPYAPKHVQAFGNRVAPMLEMRLNNSRENRELTQLRDWLLPMLMNGQVSVA